MMKLCTAVCFIKCKLVAEKFNSVSLTKHPKTYLGTQEIWSPDRLSMANQIKEISMLVKVKKLAEKNVKTGL